MAEAVDDVVERVFRDVFGRSLFFLVDEVEVTKEAVEVDLAFHRPPALNAMLMGNAIVTTKIERFRASLSAALPRVTCTVRIVPVDVEMQRLRLYLKQEGPEGERLLAELEKSRG